MEEVHPTSRARMELGNFGVVGRTGVGVDVVTDKQKKETRKGVGGKQRRVRS